MTIEAGRKGIRAHAGRGRRSTQLYAAKEGRATKNGGNYHLSVVRLPAPTNGAAWCCCFFGPMAS